MNNKIFKIVYNCSFLAVMLACIILTIIFNLSVLTLVSSLAGIAYIVFLSDRSVFNFIIGCISTATYIVISFKYKLYGEVIFYFVFDLPMIIISYLLWKKHLVDKYKVETKKLSVKSTWILIIVSVLFVAGYSVFLKLIGGTNTIVDATSTVASAIATILMALRYREQWIMWVLVYLVSIIMWATTFDLLMLIMSISCFVCCFVGYINWKVVGKEDSNE